MDIQDIIAISLLNVHGPVQYMCNQYKITYTDKKRKILKGHLDGGEQFFPLDFCTLVLADFFSII